MIYEPPTIKQVEFMNSLIAQKEIPEGFPVLPNSPNRGDVSKQIEALLKLPVKKQAAPPAATQPEKTIPAGRYAVTGNDNTTDFYQVNHGKPGTKWEGVIFVDLLTGAPGGFNRTPIYSKAAKNCIIDKIAANPEAALRRFGIELGICGICGSPLTNPESIAYGIGAKCREKVGF